MDTRTLLHIIYLLLFFLFQILFLHFIPSLHLIVSLLVSQRTVIHLHMAPTYRRFFFFSHKRSTYRLILQLVYFTSHLLFGYLGGVDCQDSPIVACFRALIEFILSTNFACKTKHLGFLCSYGHTCSFDADEFPI